MKQIKLFYTRAVLDSRDRRNCCNSLLTEASFTLGGRQIRDWREWNNEGCVGIVQGLPHSLSLLERKGSERYHPLWSTLCPPVVRRKWEWATMECQESRHHIVLHSTFQLPASTTATIAEVKRRRKNYRLLHFLAVKWNLNRQVLKPSN